MVKRLTRIYEVDGKDHISASYGNPRHTTKRTFAPLDKRDFGQDGLDSEVRLGRVDLERLNNARKIKVTITTVD